MTKIILESAPANETLEQCCDRFIVLAMRRLSHGKIHEIDAVADLHERAFFGDAPTALEFSEVRSKLDRARALAFDRIRVINLLDFGRALNFDFDLARALNFAFAMDLALDLDHFVNDLLIILGDRLQSIDQLDKKILTAVDVTKEFKLEMNCYHGFEADCGTTHCRAGSACYMHPIGKQLEDLFGNWMAGALIYKKSTGRVPDFFASNEDAMADIRKCAGDQ